MGNFSEDSFRGLAAGPGTCQANPRTQEVSVPEKQRFVRLPRVFQATLLLSRHTHVAREGKKQPTVRGAHSCFSFERARTPRGNQLATNCCVSPRRGVWPDLRGGHSTLGKESPAPRFSAEDRLCKLSPVLLLPGLAARVFRTVGDEWDDNVQP